MRFSPARLTAGLLALSAAVAAVLTTHAPAAEGDAPPVPQWLWTSKSAKDDDTALFRKAFEVKDGLKSASLSVTCDNWVRVQINGEDVVQHATWESPVREEVTKKLKPGENVILLRCRNEGGAAGVLAQLTLRYEDGSRQDVVTDGTWQASSEVRRPTWGEPVVLGRLGMTPWGNLPFGDALAAPASTPVDAITVPKGFAVDLIYSVPKGEQGSWVSLTTDDKGRLIASDQYGGLFRIVPGKPGHEDETTVEPLDVPIGDAQGLLYAFGSLYVVVNGEAAQGSGLYRVRDTDGDDRYDAVELLKKLDGGGEHGPHAIRLGPDGRRWVIAGNHTEPPAPVTEDSPLRNYDEDHLLKRNPDGNGHATGRMAPGGWIARTDKDGKEWTLFCGGFRNPYDFAFNADGEIFTYDADMEWDTGTPWYRPTRVNHGVSAAEFGWRYGTGKWPDYYVDSVGSVVDIGLGSPTGVEFGYGAKFPHKYQRAFFIEDWTYGKVYAVHLVPKGATYAATFETFAEGRPLPVTDLAVNPHDGHMYLTIGGRRMQSGLYRIRYVGDEPTGPAPNLANEAGAKARDLRRSLEAFHGKTDPRAVETAWPHLNSGDRAIRYAARVAVEHQPLDSWRGKALAEDRTNALIQAAVALARAGTPLPAGEKKALQADVLVRLNSLPLERMTEEQVLDACRAYQLAFIRLGGKPEPPVVDQLVDRFDALVPAQSEAVNRELTTLLVYLEAPGVIEKSLRRLAEASTQQDQMFYVFTLRTLGKHWTPERRRTFFSWIQNAEATGRGGNSFGKFLQQIREDAKATMPPDQIAALSDVIEGKAPVESVGLQTTRQFVHNWQLSDFAGELSKVESGRDFESGRRAYHAAQCAKCHRFAGEGGDTGPDVTGVGARFSPEYILESIVEPSKAISDQYRNTIVVTADGEVLTGRVLNETDTHLLLRTDPFAREPARIAKADIVEQQPSPTSEMPQGQINVLTKEEVLDLIAYLRSAGNPNDRAFQKR
ncbi:MAG TPA: c-type cytochrome, partial [Planctomycetaceae bacterium]